MQMTRKVAEKGRAKSAIAKPGRKQGEREHTVKLKNMRHIADSNLIASPLTFPPSSQRRHGVEGEDAIRIKITPEQQETKEKQQLGFETEVRICVCVFFEMRYHFLHVTVFFTANTFFAHLPRVLVSRCRLAAAASEAEGEMMQNALKDEKKLERQRIATEKEQRHQKLSLMKDLARSTKILVASLKADGVNVEEYFRNQELEERKAELMRQFENMSQRSYSTVISNEGSARSGEDNLDGLGAIETELQRRERLREEQKKEKQTEESDAMLREELERKRIDIINEEEKNRRMTEKKNTALKKKADREFILERRRDLKIDDKRKELAETKVRGEVLCVSCVFVGLANDESSQTPLRLRI